MSGTDLVDHFTIFSELIPRTDLIDHSINFSGTMSATDLLYHSTIFSATMSPNQFNRALHKTFWKNVRSRFNRSFNQKHSSRLEYTKPKHRIN